MSLQDVQVNLLTAMKIRRLINKPHAVTVNVYTQTQYLLEVISLYNGLKHGDDFIVGSQAVSYTTCILIDAVYRLTY